METIDVNIELRNGTGKGIARRLRRNGTLPGVFYGPKAESVPLQVNRKELRTLISDLGGSHLIRMKCGASVLDNKVALIKQIQTHPITGEVIHMDLYEVDLTVKLTAKVPLHFEGKPQGVVRGGILQPIVREIEVECLPQNIPTHFNVDVTSMDIGDTFHVSSLSMPDGVSALFDSDFTLVTVVAPTVEEAPKAVAAAAEGEAGATPVAAAEGEAKPEGGSGS